MLRSSSFAVMAEMIELRSTKMCLNSEHNSWITG